MLTLWKDQQKKSLTDIKALALRVVSGYAFLMFLGGKLMPGIDIVLSETGLEADVEWADTVITGEGRIDAQTMMGDGGSCKACKEHGKYVIAIGGCLGDGAENCVKKDCSMRVLCSEQCAWYR